MQKIKRFENFYDEYSQRRINEGFLGDIAKKLSNWASVKLSQFGNKLKGFAKEFYERLAGGQVRISEKTGRPVMFLIDPQLGSVDKQVDDYFKMGSMKEAKEAKKSENSDKVSLEWEQEGDVLNVSAEGVVQTIKFEYKKRLKGALNRPVFIFGAVGIGKSEIIKGLAKEMGIGIYIIDVAAISVEDLTGLPVPEGDKKVVEYYKVGSMPREGKGILFLDELNKAEGDLLKKLNAFIQDGRLYDYELPKGWYIVAAGNRPDMQDYTETSNMGADFYSRFKCVNYVPEVGYNREKGVAERGWSKKMQQDPMFAGKVLPELVIFLAENPNIFHYQRGPGKGAFAQPRNWTIAALDLYEIIQASKDPEGIEWEYETGTGVKETKLFKNLESWRDMPSALILHIFRQAVGQNEAAPFVSYLDILRNLTDEEISKIMDANLGVTDPSGLSSKKSPVGKNEKFGGVHLYSVAITLIKKIPETADDITKKRQCFNICQYLVQYDQSEITMWLCRQLRAAGFMVPGQIEPVAFPEAIATDSWANETGLLLAPHIGRQKSGDMAATATEKRDIAAVEAAASDTPKKK